MWNVKKDNFMEFFSLVQLETLVFKLRHCNRCNSKSIGTTKQRIIYLISLSNIKSNAIYNYTQFGHGLQSRQLWRHLNECNTKQPYNNVTPTEEVNHSINM